MVKIRWSSQSREDLHQIYLFIAADSPRYAREHIQNIRKQTIPLSKFPKIGRIVPEFENEKIREILFKNYRIVYLIDQGVSVTILTIFHGSKLLL